MYLITAYFDEKTTKKLKWYMEKLADSTGNVYMLENQVPPHLTITTIQTRSVDSVNQIFERTCRSLTSDEIDIVSIGMLPHVIYATPVLNQYLYGLSEIFCKNLEETAGLELSKYYQFGRWLPHITLGKTLESRQMGKGLILMSQIFVPMKARIIRIGLAKTNPYEDIASVNLF